MLETAKKTEVDYSGITEVPRLRISSEAISMLHTRYGFASGFCAGRQVLEIGCGAGVGLGYLARRARSVVGGDYTPSLLSRAKLHYQKRISLVCLDAQKLPFKDASFDVVLLFEAIYYLTMPEEFVKECRRVLRSAGILLLCTANKERAGFNPSPFSKRYFTACELRQLLAVNGIDAEIFGGFPTSNGSRGGKAIDLIRRVAVRLNLIPKTMRGKEFLKRLFYGPLVELPQEAEDTMALVEPLISIRSTNQAVPEFKILYALGRVNGQVPLANETQEAFSVARQLNSESSS